MKQKVNIVIFSDTGKDPDDEITHVLLRGLAYSPEYFTSEILAHLSYSQNTQVKALGAVANLEPSHKRAQLTKGIYTMLGWKHFPTGVGTNCTSVHDKSRNLDYQFNVKYLMPPDTLEHGEGLAYSLFKKAKTKSLTLLLISGLTDVCRFIREYPKLFFNRVKNVVLMSGVQRNNGGLVRELPYCYLEPDSAANNYFDMSAARAVFHYLQRYNIPMTILTREATYAVKIPKTIFDEMAQTQHPIGIRLRDSQKHYISALWVACNLDPKDPNRKELPPRWNREYFCRIFCDGKNPSEFQEQEIWNFVEVCYWYDPLTLIAAIPKLCEYFYEPHIVGIHDTEHKIIGLSEKNHGVKNPQELVDFLRTNILGVLAKTSKKANADLEKFLHEQKKFEETL